MAEPVKLAPAAELELSEYRKKLIRWVKAYLITADQSRKLHIEKLRELIGHALVVAPSDENVATRCSDCGTRHVMPRSVRFYHCKCSPAVDRFPFVQAEILVP